VNPHLESELLFLVGDREPIFEQDDPRPDEHPFAVGQSVRHAKFGDGVVINFEGRGLDARVQVRFASEGTKWLALQYAKLTAV
jgi:hypothetical protein